MLGGKSGIVDRVDSATRERLSWRKRRLEKRRGRPVSTWPSSWRKRRFEKRRPVST